MNLFTGIFIVLSNHNQLQDGNVNGTTLLQHGGNYVSVFITLHIHKTKMTRETANGEMAKMANGKKRVNGFLSFYLDFRWQMDFSFLFSFHFILYFSFLFFCHLLPAVAAAAPAVAPVVLLRMCFSSYKKSYVNVNVFVSHDAVTSQRNATQKRKNALYLSLLLLLWWWCVCFIVRRYVSGSKRK